MKYIPLDQCVDRAVYRIKSRNLGIGVFNKESNGFIGIRTKFGDSYLFTELHHDTGPPFGTVRPAEQIGVLPEEIRNGELTINEFGSRDFAIDPGTGKERCVVRRDLSPGESQHGGRMGFVDEWADTKERLPDGVWPYVKQNKRLMDFLESK